MLSRNVVIIFVLKGCSEMVTVVIIARMFCLTEITVSICRNLDLLKVRVTHTKIALAALAGTSLFSSACVKSSLTVFASWVRFHADVSVAYSTAKVFPFLTMLLINELLKT